MLEVMGGNETGYLTEEEINKFPTEDFNKIDSLWVKYSQGRFGFTVQQKIFDSIKSQAQKLDYNHFKALVEPLGWAGADPGKEWLGGHIFD